MNELNSLRIENLRVESISNSEANGLSIKYHYLHRRCAGRFSFGLYLKQELVGFIIYSQPASRTVWKGLFPEIEEVSLIELGRLWVRDDLPRNTESWFISQTVRQVPIEVVVSYADTKQGHVGYVYQASNWYYYGTTMPKIEWVDDSGFHERHSKGKFPRERSKKHRYLYLNCDRRRKKFYLKHLKYKVLPYPKLGNLQ